MTEVAAIILERRRAIALGGLTGAILVGLLAVVTPRAFESHISFVPAASRDAISGLSGVAAQLGLSAGNADVGGPDYYADLSESDAVLRTVALDSVAITRAGGKVEVSALLNIEASRQDQAVERTVRKLRKVIAPKVAPTSGIVTLTVFAPDPLAAKELADNIFARISEVDRSARNAQAAAQHAYATARREESETRLRVAEDRLQSFLASNRDFRSSPQLTFAYNRLERAVNLEQLLYTSLAQAEQNAGLDESRNTPTLSPIDTAMVAVDPVSRRVGIKGFAGLLAGLIGTGMLLVLADRLRAGGSLNPGARLHVAALATREDVRRLLRLRRGAH